MHGVGRGRTVKKLRDFYLPVADHDLRVWQTFLASFNGKSFFLDETWFNSDKLNLFTDAAGTLGLGAIFGNKWCYGKWPDEYCNCGILPSCA